ncbi:MAG TPA: MMPL family transporter, partial [Pilimelia sp.]|nr:MMPL family transporter [Pilimelia sp.]
MTRSIDDRPRRGGLPAGRRTKFLLLALWLVLVAVAAPLGAKLTEVQDNEALGALPAGAEAARAVERASAAFAGSDALVAVAVYARPGGLTDADRAKVEADRAAFAGFALDGGVPPAVPSPDGAALLLSFPLAGDNERQSDATTKIKERVAAGNPAGLSTGLTGSAVGFTDVMEAFEGLDVTLLLVTGGVVVLLLLLIYRSPTLWLVPLLAVVVASQLASAGIYLLARYADLPVDLQSQSILTVLVFGVGIDYALLLIARYREELRRHRDRHDAMAVALRQSYPAILASAATVGLGLLCLLAADMPATRGLGPVAALGVLAALAAMTTLLPALLLLCGRWLFWPFVPRYAPDAVGHDVAADHRGWARVARLVGRRPRAAWLGTVAALGALMLGMGGLSLGLPAEDNFTTEVGSITGQRIVARHYPGGASAPAEILAAAGAADAVVAAARGVPGVA